MESGKELANEEHPDFPISMEWNEDGSLLATTCKDKIIRVYDPRAPKAMLKGTGLGGAKGQRVVWVGGNRLLSVGFQANNSRGYSLFDCKKMDKEIANADLDSSPGSIIPYYDADLAMLYLVGKGDAAIKYWEIDGTEPYVHFLNESRDNESIKGMCAALRRRSARGWLMCRVRSARAVQAPASCRSPWSTSRVVRSPSVTV